MATDVPGAQAISAASIPSNDPDTPLSPTLYKFIFLLVAFVLFFWVVRLIIRVRRVQDLWKAIKDESVVRVEGPGAASHLTRDSLFAILRSRSMNKVEDITQIRVRSHVQTNKCKVVRPLLYVGSKREGVPANLVSLTPQFYELSFLLTSTAVAKLEIYVGVPAKLIQQMYRSHDKFLARNTRPKKAASATTAAGTGAADGDPALLQTTGDDSPHNGVANGPDAEFKENDVTSPKLPVRRSSIDLVVLPAASPATAEDAPSPLFDHTTGEQEHSEFLRSYIMDSIAAAPCQSLLRPGEFTWKSNCFIVQAPASAASTPNGTEQPAAAAATPTPFQQTFTVSIPLNVLQRACRDVPATARQLYPIVIHCSTIDLAVNGANKAAATKASRAALVVSELTIAELTPNPLAVNNLPQQKAAGANGAAATGSSAAAPTAATFTPILAPTPSSPRTAASRGGASILPPSSSPPVSEDAFLTRLKFEKQFLLVSPPVSSGTKPLIGVPPHAPVYEVEELYGLHTSVRLPDVADVTPPPASSPASRPSTPGPGSAPPLADSSECVACMSEVKDIILLPCRHVCLCHACHESVNKCPVCRAPILAHMRFVDQKDTVAAGLKRKKTTGMRKRP